MATDKDSKWPDNPLAFPSGDGETIQFDAGMTLRDYFAAKWLHGASSFWANTAADVLARQAYEMADAMLTERSKGAE